MVRVALVGFIGSTTILFYVYFGYLILLRGLVLFFGKPREQSREETVTTPAVTVLVTVHNEQARIRECLDNILSLDYPREKLDVLVASDGSSDETDSIVAEYASRAPVRLLRLARVGKSAAQNAAVAQCRSEIVALADADSKFEREYLRNLILPFSEPSVGCVTAELHIRRRRGAIAEGQGWYWGYELRLRQLESALGILAVASGSAMAFRRVAFRALPADVGEDCMIPLDCAMQSLKVVHATQARASDSMNEEETRELNARIRMTLRNWIGTWQRSDLLNPFRCPGYAFALWSHKVLRWLSPFFLLAMTVCSLALISTPLFRIAPLAMGLFYFAAFVGWRAQARGWRLPLVGLIYSFCLANVGFFWGVVYALSGRSITLYTTVRG
jgi:cellulose synthase/poly-beta-1,6-N-acetylglucosamine synthase-like glycosyltransferase